MDRSSRRRTRSEKAIRVRARSAIASTRSSMRAIAAATAAIRLLTATAVSGQHEGREHKDDRPAVTRAHGNRTRARPGPPAAAWTTCRSRTPRITDRRHEEIARRGAEHVRHDAPHLPRWLVLAARDPERPHARRLERPLRAARRTVPRPAVEALRAKVATRLARVPRFRQRLAFPPLRLAEPSWVDDHRLRRRPPRDRARRGRRTRVTGAIPPADRRDCCRSRWTARDRCGTSIWCRASRTGVSV